MHRQEVLQTIPRKREFKIEARLLKKMAKGVGSCSCHEVLARSYGFKSYNSYLKWDREQCS